MEDNDLPLQVPLQSLTDYIQCSICMCTLDKTMVTVCGHRYCEKCISEWVNRQHKCPCCNHDLNLSQLIKDHQFDSMLSTIKSEKDKAETNYFDALINKATSDDNPGTEQKSMNPVEHVLKRHLKEGLVAHESYFQTLRKSCQAKVQDLELSTEKAVLELSFHGLSQEEVLLQTQDLHNSLERRKQDLQLELDTCAQMVADAYDKYLSNHIPSLDVLPVISTIVMAEKNTKIPDVTFMPSDTIQHIKDSVESAMIKKHNPVHEWGPDVRFFLFGPFAKCTECEMETIIKNYLHHGNLIPDVQILSEGCMLGLQYGMKPGSYIVVYGTVKLESDLPKRCFVEVFNKDDPTQKVDYFSCAQCSFKWICRSCMETCHQGHDTSPYIMQHQPPWACCYCPKKKTCKIVQPVSSPAK